MTLLADTNQAALVTDNAVPVVTNDGRQVMFVPFRLGVPPSIHRRDATGSFRPVYPALASFLSQQPPPPNPSQQVPGVNGTPVAIQQPIVKMSLPTAVPQMRISSNGGMRLTAPAVVNGASGTQSTVSVAVHNSPPQPVPVPRHTSPNGINGIASRPAIAMPHVDVVKAEVHQPSALTNAVTSIQQTDSMQSTESTSMNNSPARQKVPFPSILHGHLPPGPSQVNTTFIPGMYAHLGPATLQNLKSTFANLPNLQNQLQRMPYMSALALNSNASLKAAAMRQMQWTNSPLQRSPSTGTGLDAVNGANGVQSSSTTNHISATAPATNGPRPAMRIPSNGQMSMSPIPHTPPHQSPPRLPITPTMTMASPSLQQQQVVGSSQVGYWQPLSLSCPHMPHVNVCVLAWPVSVLQFVTSLMHPLYPHCYLASLVIFSLWSFVSLIATSTVWFQAVYYIIILQRNLSPLVLLSSTVRWWYFQVPFSHWSSRWFTKM